MKVNSNTTKLNVHLKMNKIESFVSYVYFITINFFKFKSEQLICISWNRPTGCMTEETAPPSVDFGGGT